MKRMAWKRWTCALALVVAGCSGSDDGRGGGTAGGRSGGGPGAGAGSGEPRVASVPVEIVAVECRDIASYIETNGTLEAEKEVDIVARTSGPIVLLPAEENQVVRTGQLLARLDADAIRAQLEISSVQLEEAEVAFARAENLSGANLISAEAFDQAKSALDSARAQNASNKIQLDYTEIRAPFSGLIVERYVKFAQNVSNNEALFRISDFDPLLCPIQVPERELSRLANGQGAYLTVGAYRDERFEAEVLRISPVIDAATGTVRVTLEAAPAGKLRPGMFASVFLKTEVRRGALVIPKSALALDSIGDAVYVAVDGVAKRKGVELGVREGDFVEVLSGLVEGESVIGIGQDSLSDGTPIEILGDSSAAASSAAAGPGGEESGSGEPGQGRGEMTPERLEAMKQRMRDRGMSDQEIEQRLKQIRERASNGG